MYSLVLNFPIFSFSALIPKGIFHFAGSTIGGNNSEINHRFKIILWSLVVGTRGGINRAKILNLIKTTPLNANKIATTLKLDHKTVNHHVVILAKNKLVIKEDKKYDASYKFTSIMENNQNILEEIMEKIGTK